MSAPTTYNQTIVLEGGVWKAITIEDPCFTRPVAVSGQQAQGQLYAFYGRSAPPESPAATNFPGTPSTGAGVLALSAKGQWWLLYNASAGQTFALTLESNAGREPLPADDANGLFYRAGVTSIGIPANSAVQIFTANPRRKSLQISTIDAPATNYLLARYDGTAASATNFDDAAVVSYSATLKLSGIDVPKGAVSVYNDGTGTCNVVASQWE